ncbi:hypothetical protein M8J75_014804 [Diaphorina citri]|nr:hypothetical protein M8J75_014804 [Diaphorina citri]KAI5730999.1 hypothetical protein M8J77_003084 [Diaphorina citri]
MNPSGQYSMNSVINKDYIARAEIFADRVYQSTKAYLPTISRACLISTFLEDGLRMWFQWNEQREYMDLSWHCGYFLGSLFVIINLIGQLGGCILVLLQKRVPLAVGALFFIVLLQTIAYKILLDFQFLMRNLALVGALLLVLADSQQEARSVFAGVPSIGDNKPKNYMQLAGRSLLAFMYITLLRFEVTFLQVIQDLFGTALMVLVTIGYKTKLSALILVLVLSFLNIYYNCWWVIPAEKAMRDFLKYDFFQTLSVIGGLLMIVLRGPGSVSMDQHKKNW